MLESVVGIGAALVTALVALVVFGRWRWRRLTRERLARLRAGHASGQLAHVDARDLDGLPPVVQRYFRTVLPDGAPVVTAVSITHAGSFDMGETEARWKPFRSRQWVVTQRPGFLWDGHIRLAPGLPVWVHDAYGAGQGTLHPSILGLFSLTRMHGGGAFAQGELMRFLAEAPWYPTALLPSQGVSWEGVDDQSAVATLTDAGLNARLRFGFDAAGLITSVRADARGRNVNGALVMRPWEGRWSDYQLRDGMRVPMAGEVAWLLPPSEGGRKPYWRGTVTSLAYRFAPRGAG